MAKSTLTTFLNKLYDKQNKILLCYHPEQKSTWNDRCFFLEENYDPLKKYNHRSILLQEVVIEFDDANKETNIQKAQQVARKLYSYGIPNTRWYSGNKSVHVHCMIDTGNVSNRRLLKKVFTKYFCRDIGTPDLQLCSDNHLIRAEYGVHEKTGNNKIPLHTYPGYMSKFSPVPAIVWKLYYKEVKAVLRRKLTVDLKDLSTLPGIQLLNTPEEMRKLGDGRERALFILIHALKAKYVDDKEGFIQYLQGWYRYCSGTQLSDAEIERKVKYHWNRNYYIVPALNELLDELGKTEFVNNK